MMNECIVMKIGFLILLSSQIGCTHIHPRKGNAEIVRYKFRTLGPNYLFVFPTILFCFHFLFFPENPSPYPIPDVGTDLGFSLANPPFHMYPVTLTDNPSHVSIHKRLGQMTYVDYISSHTL